MVLWMRDFNRSGRGHIEFTGFDMQMPTVPMETVQAFVLVNDTSFFDTLARTYTELRKARPVNQQAFGVATANLPSPTVAGKHVRLSGYIRTEAITDGWAGLWLRADGMARPAIAFHDMQDQGPRGTTPWSPYQIDLDIPADTVGFYFGVLHPGSGTAWFNSLELEIDGALYKGLDVPELDFESLDLRGFHTGGAGYEVSLDQNIAHSGK